MLIKLALQPIYLISNPKVAATQSTRRSHVPPFANIIIFKNRKSNHPSKNRDFHKIDSQSLSPSLFAFRSETKAFASTSVFELQDELCLNIKNNYRTSNFFHFR